MYNINVQVEGGKAGRITFLGLADGVELNMIGVHSNREFDIQSGVDTYYQGIIEILKVSSLYDHQIKQRLKQN